MLTESELKEWSASLDLSTAQYTMIQAIRSSPPSRRVRGNVGNVVGRYPSKKMGVVIQFESHRNELALIYEMEYDPDVFEYYDQPPKIKLQYTCLNGRSIGVLHTPDFFVIRNKSAGWEECKTATELSVLASKMPNRYQLDSNGKWRCPPGEEFAKNLGLYYIVRSDKEINWKKQRNTYFLSDYLSINLEVPTQNIVEVIKIISITPGIKLSELLEKGINPDYIYKLIADQTVYADLESFTLSTEPEKIGIYINKETANALLLPKNEISWNPRKVLDLSYVGASGTWDGQTWHIINVGENNISLLSESSQIISLPNQEWIKLIEQDKFHAFSDNQTSKKIYDFLKYASVDDCIEASRRYLIISGYLQGGKADFTEVPKRTFYRWVKNWHEADKQYGYGYLGLLPKRKNQTANQGKLTSQTQQVIDEFIQNDYLNVKQKSKYATYCSLRQACIDKGLIPPSYKTFLKNLKKIPQYETKLHRQGKRIAYKNECFYWELELTTPKHGDRPFEICHIDHTEVDIELVSSYSNVNLGRPWLTFLIDAYSRRILAIYLTFDPPSYRSCMMVMRECVRRYGRFPSTLVVDGGKEFESVYFETLLAAYTCTKKTRPQAKPRFGSVCERIFGSANTMLIHNLQGNTQITRNPRGITKSVNPKNLAIWTLGSLYQNLCDWAYEFYDNKEHPALNQSPRSMFEDGLLRTGLRSHKIIQYDDNFKIFTLPTTQKGTAKVVPNNGIKINNIYYWHNSFRHPEIEKTQVPVRYDPYDMGVAYAYIENQWVTCISQHYSSLVGHSEREIRIASEELRQRHSCANQQFVVTASSLADLLNKSEQQEVILLQRMQDIEAKGIYSTSQSNHSLVPPKQESEVLLLPIKEPEVTEVITEEIKPYEEFW
jgi:transposase InsO family protein